MTAVGTSELLDAVFDEEFGFRLSNFSIKPVHVANGLARSLAGRTYDTTAGHSAGECATSVTRSSALTSSATPTRRCSLITQLRFRVRRGTSPTRSG